MKLMINSLMLRCFCFLVGFFKHLLLSLLTPFLSAVFHKVRPLRTVVSILVLLFNLEASFLVPFCSAPFWTGCSLGLSPSCHPRNFFTSLLCWILVFLDSLSSFLICSLILVEAHPLVATREKIKR